MNFGKGISISQENDMLIGGNWLPAGTDKQFLVRSQPVPVDKQVNQAGRTNWQALLGFPGGHETQNCNGVVQNLNLVDLGGLSQTLYNWDGNFAEKNRLINHIAGSYNQNFVNGDTSTYKHIFTDGGSRVSQSQPFANSDGTGTYSQALANVGPGIYSQALANGCTVPYSQALANGSTIPYSQALANGGTVPYSQALANGGTIPYSQALANGGTNNYGQAGTNNYSQALALANGGTNNYSQTLALANGGTSTYSQALANGGTIYYQGLGNGSTIYDQGLANSGTSSYSQAFVNGSPGAYSRLIGNGSAGSGNLAIGNGDAALYSQAMHNGDIDLNEYSLQDLLGLASSASVDRSSVQAANRPPALKPSVSEALSRSIHTANRPLVLKTSASEAQNRNFHVANGPLVRKATTGEAPERSLLNASRPQVPNSHSQFEINWGEDNSIDMLLGKENQCSGSSMWKNSNGLLQIPEYGFPIPYQPSFNLNSPPGVEADATSSITNSFPCPPVTPERPKKILNFSADEGSSPDKNQEYITSTTNGATENRCDELLHNIVASSSAAPPSPCKGKNIVAKEGDEGIDLNKTPKQKQPKKRKHRPKVVIEGKPKKTPKPKVYVRKNNPKVPVTDPTDVRKEILDPSFASATAKSCKRVLNFGEEKSGDGQHDVASQQGVIQQDNEPTFTLNLTSQTKEPCTRINIISGTKVAMQNDQQNELVVKSQQMSAVESQQISADYIAMLKSSRRQMMQSTSQTNKFANSNQATGSKRDYCHTIEQSQAHAAHLIGPSLCQEIFQSTMASYTTAGEDELHQAEAKSVNQLTSQINHGILNICFEDTAGNSMWKHHISNEWPSQTEDMREKQVNGCTQLHSLTVLTAAAKDKLQPPAPIKARSYSSGQHSIESCRVITLAEKQKEPLFSNSHSSSTYKPFLQEPKDKLGKCNHLIQGDGAIIPYEIKKRKPRPKVDLDLETERVWKLLMGAEQDVGDSDERKAKWWEEEREVFRGRADSFIARMHLVQGDRRFSPWKGSVVDSVIGVFLTQNVSDHLSSSAFMSLVSRFPLHPESNKTSYSNEASILVEEPEVCIMNPDDTIKWHEKVSHQQVYNQAFVASSESSEHRRDSPDSGTSETSLVGAPNQRAEEEVMSSQDSVNSSVVQTTVLRSCSGSNSEAEDPTTGHKTNKVQASASTNILYMEKTFMSQECQYHANKSSNFDENTMRYRKQNPRLDRVENHTESSSLTYLINSGNSNKQAPAVPSSNYRLHMTPDSGILEVECLQVLGEESISSWPSAASGIANPKDVNWTSKGTQQMTESIRKTTAQQNGLMNLQEATVGNPNALLRNYPMQQSSMQPGCTTENDKQSCKNHDLERTKTFQMQSMPSREPLKPAEALDTRRDTTMHQIPNVPELTEEASNVRERDSAVDKQICLENEVLEPLSREQVHSSNKESGGTTTNI
ncbi:Transcriptional activator DEMETER [Vitis vinifera]|uniref:Transcriptional activator DEMETER n=1 Tax=Vitis vinifera TaxID=29760 RepID=A0A438FKN2_VITVI|nr:Transcriptional activator DEMETER [Vitis vinifera]